MFSASNPIVLFITTLIYGLCSVAELIHSGQADAGASKKSWTLAQLEAMLAGTPPIIGGVNPAVVSAIWTVLRFLVPFGGGSAIDYLVKKANAVSFFVAADPFLESVLGMLSAGSTPTPTVTPTNSTTP
jgi:hypothetical protein